VHGPDRQFLVANPARLQKLQSLRGRTSGAIAAESNHATRTP
jgi:hypothetical protein